MIRLRGVDDLLLVPVPGILAVPGSERSALGNVVPNACVCGMRWELSVTVRLAGGSSDSCLDVIW
jgi:hypothetical protein